MLCRDQLHQQAEQEVNDSIIIRPNGDLRLGCMAPFTCGNIREEDFSVLWQKYGGHAWRSPKVRAYVNAVEDNPTLMTEYKRLGIINGYENVRI